ncbi:hypothetical protein [Cecembia calidifontis]|jgi:heme/copper-type cytochrome/quinol oxidase subunit 2|uniref:Uncharacterized protein n=1 Tax=Cecembia calidifontis TaxID=1187080 RepID=A0A4Q7PB09_9BACT|nr:hypothetical protein [Cecembia calidifontis]RZS96740.1 hypothetical protein BC751_2326 [Cecembia calidifontis]
MKTNQFLIYLAIGVLVFFIIKPYNFTINVKDTSYIVGYSMPWTIFWTGIGIIYLIMKQKNRAS